MLVGNGLRLDPADPTMQPDASALVRRSDRIFGPFTFATTCSAASFTSTARWPRSHCCLRNDTAPLAAETHRHIERRTSLQETLLPLVQVRDAGHFHDETARPPAIETSKLQQAFGTRSRGAIDIFVPFSYE